MKDRTIFAPLVMAFDLLRSRTALLVFAAFLVVAVVSRPLMVTLMSDPLTLGVIDIRLVGFAVSLLLAGFSQYMIGRNLLLPGAQLGNVPWVKWIGLIVAIFVVKGVVGFILATMLVMSSQSDFALTYGSMATGCVATILTFPLVVRALLAVAGIQSPKLGDIADVSFNGLRTNYFWFAVVALVFPLLMVFAFTSLSGWGYDANAMQGNVLQSAITSLGQVLEMLLALVAARSLVALSGDQAETFA